MFQTRSERRGDTFQAKLAEVLDAKLIPIGDRLDAIVKTLRGIDARLALPNAPPPWGTSFYDVLKTLLAFAKHVGAVAVSCVSVFLVAMMVIHMVVISPVIVVATQSLLAFLDNHTQAPV